MSAEGHDVKLFQIKFGVPMPDRPTFLPDKHHEFRVGFMREELIEFEEAVRDQDMVKALDALIDLQYVLLGTMLMMGLESYWDTAWHSVQTANMRKVRAPTAADSKRGSALDVIKPPGWTPPDYSFFPKGPWPKAEE
jgi:predicted HAD superfamily Cof-like phosphohydrolase